MSAALLVALAGQLARYNPASATERAQAGEALADYLGDERLDLARNEPLTHPVALAVAGQLEFDPATNEAVARYRIAHAQGAQGRA